MEIMRILVRKNGDHANSGEKKMEILRILVRRKSMT